MGIERRISVLNAMMCKVLLSADHQRGGSKCVDASVPPVFTGRRCCAGSRWLQVILLKQWDSDGWLHGGHEFCMQKLLGWGFLGIPWDSQDAAFWMPSLWRFKSQLHIALSLQGSIEPRRWRGSCILRGLPFGWFGFELIS